MNKTGLAQITVQFRGGTYFLPSTVNFVAAHSGTPQTQIVYENYPGETPIISGGLQVTGCPKPEPTSGRPRCRPVRLL